MAPNEHLQWLDDNVDWFNALPIETLAVEVPNCPGWNVEKVLNHLALGLGLAYPYALSAAPDSSADRVWADVPWPDEAPSGSAAIESFGFHLGNCLSTFRETDPDQRCWTYAGPGHARFWFRRAAIETTLHRMDVSDALQLDEAALAEERVVDAIAESIDFALPLAASMVGGPNGALAIAVSGHEGTLVLGDGPPRAEIAGRGDDVLAALWGRDQNLVEISGDRHVAGSWMAVIEKAFAGR